MRMTMIMMSALLVAAPASATQSGRQGASSGNEAATATAKERKYCIQYEDFTGSRTGAKMECKTRTQWAKQGVQVDKLGKD
ncbi:hypothetical protein [Sphingomonas sp.]|uniref:hypothetical protein n=1 Tax=Sphingomonas sp. TaxID=28214 RepID=UPI00286E5559|nr:hypothetical protein [Sphingomonas sp.]